MCSTPATIPSRRSALRASAAENVLRLAMVSRSGSESPPEPCRPGEVHRARLGSCSDPAEGSAVRTGGSPGALYHCDGALPAFERDHGHAGQALKLQSDMGIGAYRSVCGNCDLGQHLPRIVGAELKICDLPDADAVEQNGRAWQQSRHGVLETDVVNGSLVQSTGVVQPVYTKPKTAPMAASTKRPMRA